VKHWFVTVILLGGLSAPAGAQSERHLAAAAQVLELNGLQETLHITDSAYVAAVMRSSPLWEPYRDVLQEWVDHVYDWDVVRPALAQRLAANFTEAELAELLAFYQKPLGKKLLTLRPQLQRDLMDLTFTAMEHYQPELKSKLRKRAVALNRPVPRLN
jgi:Uncharacterized protein conserved in bacteria (DUF2059)